MSHSHTFCLSASTACSRLCEVKTWSLTFPRSTSQKHVLRLEEWKDKVMWSEYNSQPTWTCTHTHILKKDSLFCYRSVADKTLANYIILYILSQSTFVESQREKVSYIYLAYRNCTIRVSSWVKYWPSEGCVCVLFVDYSESSDYKIPKDDEITPAKVICKV